ncbi:uncharacterized protein LOC102946203 isoform X4 [Chelonia mydas]|uniref:uncharacterized protein LOC102946203 isoform X4 n=1 Tax=Chelonia mydas TaxID=8469 RepID=UPI0018A24856|nr:uncharacterized protein LOC102946203 isoform X4 [Chelonia mydas]
MPPCVTVLIIGAGCRGKHYSYFAVHFPNRMKVVGVADPHAFARNDLQKIHCIDKKNVFNDWKVATERERFADAVIIATPDRLHKELLDAGAIGDICHIQHLEPVGFWHFAHSFVRGNWRNEAESTFSLLAKSCHDIDLIHFWMGDKRCLKVSSFGSLSHFTNEHKPKGAASRCLDCSVEQTCPYSAKKIYLQRAEKGYFNWPVSVVCNSGVCDIESVTEGLRSGPYGRCVYECDNDVVSNQVVNMEFEGGATAAFTMMAFTEQLGRRKTTVYGTKGELFCDGGGPVQVFDFCTREKTAYPTNKSTFIPSHLMGHDGADFYLMDSFISALTENKPSLIQTGPEATLQTHLLVFEAEKSRKENRVVCLEMAKELFPKPTYK